MKLLNIQNLGMRFGGLLTGSSEVADLGFAQCFIRSPSAGRFRRAGALR